TALPDNPIYKLSPMSHIATFSFGALAGFRKGQWKKPIFFAITLYSLVGIVPFGIAEAAFIIVTAFFVLFSAQITVPRVFGSIMYKIAGASFFIYLLHMPIYNIFYVRFNLPADLCFMLALFVGYSGWIGWDWLSQKVSQSLRSDWPSPGNEVNAGVG
ncbi:MAG TPA: hypothetical protein VKP60_15710, partial [Magnetospirillaceae bacterium]|nr:hypothetical protein [Magnetospirillaceae bacterium]